MSPPTSQATEHKGLTEDKVIDCKSTDAQLRSSFDLDLLDDPDFVQIAEQWSELSPELKAAIVRMMK